MNNSNCAFYLWMNTCFLEDKVRLTREQLDNPHKPASWSTFGEDFAVELYFRPVELEEPDDALMEF